MSEWIGTAHLRPDLHRRLRVDLGSATTVSGTVSLVDTRAADGSQQGNTVGFTILQPNQTFRVNMPLTISTWYNEQHNITLIIDPGNEFPKTTGR
ncbi:MAG: hypothetical protein U0521_23445 [Anaerolineae bacterium]